MSHLSDLQAMSGIVAGKDFERMNRNRINFCKFLILKYQKDLTVEIDPDYEYVLYESWANSRILK
jgi:hypothetical protein